jgi:hypothetical protein
MNQSASAQDKRYRIRYDQSKLQDFVECARRFQLRHLLDQDWPAPAAEPLADAERAADLGRRFHLLMERRWRGLPIQNVDPALSAWWEAFRNTSLDLPGTVRRPEITVAAMIEGQRMTATFDLLAFEPGGEAVIVDWKTSRRPPRYVLDRRLQTIIYPLLLVESAQRSLGHPIAPEQVTFVYWFAGEPEPGSTEVFRYSAARQAEDHRFVGAVLRRLFSMEVDAWPLTTNERMCRWCQYRSLCGRGRDAAALGEENAEVWPDLDELRGIMAEAEAAAAEDFVL